MSREMNNSASREQNRACSDFAEAKPVEKRELKYSSIPWIGDIPKGWKRIFLKHYFHFEKGKNAAIYTQEYIGSNLGDFPVYSGQTENQGIMGRINTFDYDESECLFTTTVGAKVMTPKILQGKFSLSQNCLIMKRIKDASVHWFFYGLSALFDYEKSLIPSHMQPSLRIEDLKKYILYIPSITEQQKIASFLDRKCAEVDEMITLQEKIIEELKAYKQSVITEAVTKGLNPNLPMKESGIEWIGQIPAHWEVTQIKRIAETNSGSTPKNIINNENSDIVWIRTTDINDDVVSESSLHLNVEEFSSASCPILKKGSCVVAMYGGGGTIGKSGILAIEATINQALCSMEVLDTYIDKYLFYVLRSVRFFWMKYAVGTRKDPNISQDVVRNMHIPFPVKSEQQSIADYLDTKCTEIDNLISIKQQKIEHLKEYKKSIIYEYVTGKKEVK